MYEDDIGIGWRGKNELKSFVPLECKLKTGGVVGIHKENASERNTIAPCGYVELTIDGIWSLKDGSLAVIRRW